MKKLLFIALLMPVGLMAQKDSAITILFPLKNDTVKVIMLVCDTSHVFATVEETIPDTNSNSLVAHYKEFKIDKGYPDNRLVYWIVGYRYDDANWYQKYLDADKKTLKDGIVVWMSASIK